MVKNQMVYIKEGLWQGRYALYRGPAFMNKDQSLIRFPNGHFSFAVPTKALEPVKLQEIKRVQFCQVLGQTPDGAFYPISMQNIQIGQPCILQLANGNIIRTSNVKEWTIYGHTQIRTEHTIHYAL